MIDSRLVGICILSLYPDLLAPSPEMQGWCGWVVAGSVCALAATDRAFSMWGFLVARGWLQEEQLRNDEPRRYSTISA